VVAQQIAQTTQLHLAIVLKTKRKSLIGDRLVHDFQSRIVSQRIQNRSIRFPQKLEPAISINVTSRVASLPRHENFTIGAITISVRSDGTQHELFRTIFNLIQILNLIQHLRLSSRNLLLGQRQPIFNEPLTHVNQRVPSQTHFDAFHGAGGNGKILELDQSVLDGLVAT
jgi:hypothetical protein